jgi:hypothetical protein
MRLLQIDPVSNLLVGELVGGDDVHLHGFGFMTWQQIVD